MHDAMLQLNTAFGTAFDARTAFVQPEDERSVVN
jgi:hypothetical protein